MGSEWTQTTLGSVIELKRGYDLPSQDRRLGSVPIVTSSGVSDYHAEAKVKGPGVVTGRYGTIGQVYYIQEDFWPHNTTLYVKDFKGNDPRFISYFLRTIQYLSYSDKAAVPGINRNHLHQALVTVPPLPEQRAIAAVLGSLDDKIELNRRMNATLEATARALFKSWFVDFDPVRAKMEGRESGLPEDIDALFPAEMEDGRPKGWRIGTIGAIAQVVGGSTPSTKEPKYWDGVYHWTTPKDLSSLSVPVLLSSERKITEAGLSQISSGLLPVGTILLSSRAPIGYLAIIEVPTAINQGFIAMIANEGISNLFLLLWAEEAHDEIVARANGSTFLEISKTNFRPIELVVPPRPIMEAFDGLVRPLYERIVTNEKESRTLAALRDALLPKLMSGDIRIKGIERLE